MKEEIISKINGFGITFRFVTPILIGCVGWLVVSGVAGINKKMDDLDGHFSNHLSHHQDLEVGYERRLTQIEGTRFTYLDGQKVEGRIISLENKVAGLPPLWLIDKIKEMSTKVDSIEKELRNNSCQGQRR